MKPANVELLLVHDLGISKSYYKPLEKDVLKDYLKATNVLTFYSENYQLSKKLQDLKDINQNNIYIIKGKLQDKEQEIKKLREQYENDMKLLEDKIENRFQELLQKVDVQRLLKP